VNPDELQDRVCRACGRVYKYPIPKSRATRFYCANCMNLDADVRAMLEHFHKRLKSLRRELDALKAEVRGDGS
jgi:hypothetical protein